ncbi:MULTISPECIES: winged helix-turn-helix domain-containing protein [unclassified Undibacterium]|uniref:winged helix-turn-helix domain-containing protein n=1 Tax=unclassified Undibacterium TaxID=2630295 RepID=UPI002AC97854|nr:MULTISPECIES: winged helix-turn-helix domain-containing protein [unclassified Undibacterium]MEB0140404.1 winged helix-turn-helix domain-containing protein [Undibacterium sp. CCC2.1]MEB0173438.1 winged helix-turn-helix domain-containing protein [Undibacterium sp. CCC1.1]MEB0177338.1 winged helix-turn-helix domain-containing protein [Undibacterium sp. CCC3.4]MEB0216596.1 winged helix-turn-helix domain-containing protein [Undibacterium sp. 5I2]WPX43497.1 winged helix-turn-helix domain-containi
MNTYMEEHIAFKAKGEGIKNRPSTQAKRQFVIGDFVLDNSILMHNGVPIPLPPKELAVLICLLESGGEIVPKDTLLERAWGNAIVSEESLTRCIYVLRRMFLERTGQHYIQNVYGQGYRLLHTVNVIYDTQRPIDLCTLAVLPFRFDGWDIDTQEIHDSTIQCLCHFRPFGLSVMPASLTRNCRVASEIISMIKDMEPDFYVTGFPVIVQGIRVLRLELVNARDHAILHRENFDVTLNNWQINLQHRLTTVLPLCIPELSWGNGVPQQIPLPTTLAFLNGKRELRQFTPTSLKQALSQFHACLAIEPLHAQSWCALAETCLALVSFGLCNDDAVLRQACRATDKALSIEPNNPLALALMAYLNSVLGNGERSETLILKAISLAPTMPELHYYHARHLFLAQRMPEAAAAVKTSLSFDPANISAILLSVWIHFTCSNITQAITEAEQNLTLYAHDNPILQDMLETVRTHDTKTSRPMPTFFLVA